MLFSFLFYRSCYLMVLLANKLVGNSFLCVYISVCVCFGVWFFVSLFHLLLTVIIYLFSGRWRRHESSHQSTGQFGESAASRTFSNPKAPLEHQWGNLKPVRHSAIDLGHTHSPYPSMEWMIQSTSTTTTTTKRPIDSSSVIIYIYNICRLLFVERKVCWSSNDWRKERTAYSLGGGGRKCGRQVAGCGPTIFLLLLILLGCNRLSLPLKS